MPVEMYLFNAFKQNKNDTKYDQAEVPQIPDVVKSIIFKNEGSGEDWDIIRISDIPLNFLLLNENLAFFSCQCYWNSSVNKSSIIVMRYSVILVVFW